MHKLNSGAKVVDLQMVAGFGFQEFKEQACPGCYFVKIKEKWLSTITGIYIGQEHCLMGK